METFSVLLAFWNDAKYEFKMTIRLAFNKMHWKISAKCQPFCLGPNMFIILIWFPHTKTAVTTLVMHWSYCSLALSHWLDLMGIKDIASEAIGIAAGERSAAHPNYYVHKYARSSFALTDSTHSLQDYCTANSVTALVPVKGPAKYGEYIIWLGKESVM